MAIIGVLLQEVVKRKRTNVERKENNFNSQQETLKKLIQKAKNTAFGKKYSFDSILKSKNICDTFQQQVPIYTYEKIYNEWWYRLFNNEPNVCWPRKIKFFALTSGTSNASSKKVPVSSEMIQSIRRTGVRQLLAISEFDLLPNYFQKGALMLGGSTSLYKVSEYLEGDLSGILQKNLPFWFNKFYKPGKPIAKERDWTKKLDDITLNAPKWDIGAIAGVPAWVQLLLEKIINHYQLNNIHEIWPNLKIYVHGGVSFEPYRKSFSKLLGKEIHYLETYLASEGFLAYQSEKDKNMQLVLDNGIFFEFVPFNEKNFGPDGIMIDNPETILLDQVTTGVDYALLISTNAGAWRYLIGDTIRFTSVENYEIIITGRTRHFLSLCGEHLSVDNMNRAVHLLSEEFDLQTREFTVAGIPYENLFSHHWYIGCDNLNHQNKEKIKQRLDEILCELNDDYKTERQAALKEVFIDLLPNDVFYTWMKSRGKEGGQNKVPRVINGFYDEWKQFLETVKS